MKEKIIKIILIISSLPFVWWIFFSVNCAFSGFSLSFFGEETTPTYGLEGFFDGMIVSGGVLIDMNILPICLAYQLFYLIRHLIKKHKSKTTNVNKNIEQ